MPVPRHGAQRRVEDDATPPDRINQVKFKSLERTPSLPQEIVASLTGAMYAGELRPGDRLPPIRQAAGTWGVNLNTVARAYAVLAERGLVGGCARCRT
jgi:DNA-binding transcriptional regulator YhcF (GntR family)